MIRPIEKKDNVTKVFIRRSLFRWFPVETRDDYKIINDFVWKKEMIAYDYDSDDYQNYYDYYAFHPVTGEPANPSWTMINTKIERKQI